MLTRTHTSRSRKATVLIEFVMILPLFLFLTLFAVDMGRMVLIAGALNDAAYVSARAGAQRGGAGDPNNGPARNAFNRAVETIPGAADTSNVSFAVIRGSCTTANSYIVIEARQQVDFITPGLGRLLSLIDRTDRTGDLGRSWELRSRGAVLCEVVR